MVKLYACLGQPISYVPKALSYFCGSYIISVELNTIYAQVANYFEGRIREKDEAVDVSHIALRMLDINSNISAEEIIDRLEESNLLTSATGLNHRLAVYHLLEECSYQIKFPYTKYVPELDTHYYARRPYKLVGLERKLYDIFLNHFKSFKDLEYDLIHGFESHKQYYITLPVLMKKLPPKTYTVGEVLDALAQLYEKNCITLYPKTPKFDIEDDGFKTYYYS